MSTLSPHTAPSRLHRARLVYLIVPLVAALALISGGYMALDAFATSVAATVKPVDGAADVAVGTTAPVGGGDVHAIAAQ